MGGCVCRPKTEITDNPDIAMYTLVGGTAIVHPFFSRSLGGSVYMGLMYVQDHELCYEALCGSRLCCKCAKMRWDLARVEKIRLVEDERVMVVGYKNVHWIHMNPGLEITLRVGRDDVDTIVTEMPDAANFGAQLARYVDGQAEFVVQRSVAGV